MKKLIMRLGRIIAVGLIIIGLLIIGLILSEIHFHALFSEINRLISKELPQGTNISQVISFLDSHKFEYSVVRPGPADKNKITLTEITAIRRNVGLGFLTSGNIALNFVFDKDNALVISNAGEVCTGL